VVFQRTAHGFRHIGGGPATRPPIAALQSRRHGWRDIGVLQSGGGIAPCDRVLEFDGRRYNKQGCSTPSARRRLISRRLLIEPDAKGGPLGSAIAIDPKPIDP